MSLDAVFFISCFLPVIVALYWLIRKTRWRNGLLLIAGLLFYAFGGFQGLILMLCAAAVNYLFGLLILKGISPKPVCVTAVAANLLFLGVYKYLDFLVGGLLGLEQGALSLAAPIGISFFTFKCISYIADTYRAPETGTKRFFDFLLYVSFFPQVMAGPISRFSDFQGQLENRDPGQTAPGLRRFTVGLAKKLILSGTLARIADSVFALDVLDARLAWLGAISYTLQIYFDFSGYTDMAMGLGTVFGFRMPENFRYPYTAVSVTDFWRRWHISLSSWFRDYLYIPLGGNRRGKLCAAWNKLIVFTLCGLWHGANWTFVVWGLWHGLFSALESIKRMDPHSRPRRAAARVYTLLVVCLGFVMFRSASVTQGLSVIGTMFTGFVFTDAATVALHRILSAEAVCMLLLSAVLCLPWVQWFKKRPGLYAAGEQVSYAVCLLLFALCLLRLASGGFAPFIYAQF